MGSAHTAEPIRKEFVVPLDPSSAFDLFTRRMAEWWPLGSHSVAGDQAGGVVFEPREGGGIYETTTDTTTHTWGTVTEWDPPRSVAFTFHPGREPDPDQLVVVTFTPEATGTHVTLVHSGWERFGDRAGEMRANYDTGWDFVFGERVGGAAGRAASG